MSARRSPSVLITLAVAVAVSAALVHVWVHLQVIQAGYDLGRESRLRHDLGEQNQKLRLELAVRKDPSVIERRARTELGMAPPDPTLIRVLRVRRAEIEGAAATPAVAPASPTQASLTRVMATPASPTQAMATPASPTRAMATPASPTQAPAARPAAVAAAAAAASGGAR